MHHLLAAQVERIRSPNGAVDLENLCTLVTKTYGEFDRDRARLQRSTRLMIDELSELTSQRQHALARVEDEHRKLNVALENMAHGLAMFAADGSLVVCNEQYRAIAAVHDAIGQRCGASGIETRQIVLADASIIECTWQPLADGGWVEIYRDVTAQRQADEKINYLARHDALTGLSNRFVFNESLTTECARVRRGAKLAVLYLDLDHFKSVNDSLGHPVGDELLRQVASRLRSLVRESDSVARLGGDEFAIAQISGDQPVAASKLAKRVIEALTTPFDIDGHQISVGTSVGIAVAPTDGDHADQLMRNADMALYRAKADGRRVYRFFEAAMDEAMQARRSLEQDLRKALVCEEFELYYQPLIDSDSRRIKSFEALIRWNHPVRGRVAPDNFIPLCEELGLILDIGDWVLRQACLFATTLPDDVGVAVNISPVQFRSAGLVASVKGALRGASLRACRLEIEITETVLLQDTDATIRILHELKDLGVQIAMDDFGTGYSSLNYLRKFPFDKLKIDRAFVTDLAKSSDATLIVKAVTDLAKSLGMRTTAEGVETPEQLELLAGMNCTELQGYLFSKPLPADSIAALLRAFEKSELAA